MLFGTGKCAEAATVFVTTEGALVDVEIPIIKQLVLWLFAQALVVLIPPHVGKPEMEMLANTWRGSCYIRTIAWRRDRIPGCSIGCGRCTRTGGGG